MPRDGHGVDECPPRSGLQPERHSWRRTLLTPTLATVRVLPCRVSTTLVVHYSSVLNQWWHSCVSRPDGASTRTNRVASFSWSLQARARRLTRRGKASATPRTPPGSPRSTAARSSDTSAHRRPQWPTAGDLVPEVHVWRQPAWRPLGPPAGRTEARRRLGCVPHARGVRHAPWSGQRPPSVDDGRMQVRTKMAPVELESVVGQCRQARSVCGEDQGSNEREHGFHEPRLAAYLRLSS